MVRDRIVTRLEENCRAIAACFEAPAADLRKTYAPGKWTIHEILSHVSDCELISVWRFGRAAAEPGSSVEPFDERLWADNLTYSERPLTLSQHVFLAARRLIIHQVSSLSHETLLRPCNHSEKGKVDAYAWADIAAAHAEHHLGQIAAARDGTPWVRQPRHHGVLYGVDLKRAPAPRHAG